MYLLQKLQFFSLLGVTTCWLLSQAVHLQAQRILEDHPFEILIKTENKKTKKVEYRLLKVRGNECENNSLNRLSLVSENQAEYPAPESGCGPTALLNILIWYEKYGLIEPSYRDADPHVYKQKFFKKIDRLIMRKSGQDRATAKGISTLDAALAIDEIVKNRTNGRVRIHTNYTKAPLKLADFIDVMPNFRSGYLVVSPQNKETGRLEEDHAVTLIRADRAGYITLGTWGETYRGILKQEPDGQWFIPQNPEHLKLKIIALMRFIPFEPTGSTYGF